MGAEEVLAAAVTLGLGLPIVGDAMGSCVQEVLNSIVREDSSVEMCTGWEATLAVVVPEVLGKAARQPEAVSSIDKDAGTVVGRLFDISTDRG